jgi:hypothetical protein
MFWQKQNEHKKNGNSHTLYGTMKSQRWEIITSEVSIQLPSPTHKIGFTWPGDDGTHLFPKIAELALGASWPWVACMLSTDHKEWSLIFKFAIQLKNMNKKMENLLEKNKVWKRSTARDKGKYRIRITWQKCL